MAAPEVRALPFWLPPKQTTAEAIVRDEHFEALYAAGEYVMFILWWTAIDHEQGLVEHCHTCWGSSREAQAFSQPLRNDCPDCFGTGFEGGYRAKIMRPAIITDNAPNTEPGNRGVFVTDDITVETTDDFTLRNRDIVVRSDNSRWLCSQKQSVTIRSGFAYPNSDTNIGGMIQHARLEDRESIVYKVPPTSDVAVDVLLKATSHVPALFSDAEDIRGPLVVNA